jgi:hypothetical protein
LDIFAARAQTSARQIEREAVEAQDSMGDLVHSATIGNDDSRSIRNFSRKIVLP